MKKIGLVFGGVTVAVLLIYFITFILPFLFVPKEKIIGKSRCRDEEKALEESIYGILTNKFRDNRSHMWETIEYSDASGAIQSLIFMNDRSGGFDFVLPGDSLKKAKGSLELTIARKGEIKKYRLDFGCSKTRQQ